MSVASAIQPMNAPNERARPVAGPQEQGWSGGQYSVVRILAAGSLAFALVWSSFGADGFDPVPAVLAAAALAVAAGVDTFGRTLAAVLASAISIYGGDETGSAAWQFAALWLSVHVLLPRVPYGSISAVGRTDPDGGWTMPRWYTLFTIVLFSGARLAASVHATMDDNSFLAGAFMLLAVLYLIPPISFAAWALSALFGVALAVSGHGNLFAAFLLHLLTFRPAWISPRAGADEVLFYDGTCALCHGAVRFVLAEDRAARFRIAPLGSDVFLAEVPEAARRTLPDSVVVASGGHISVRSTAAIELLEGLGGLWRVIGTGMRAIPLALRDRAYDAVASRRYRWFGRRADACPIMPPGLRGRIEV